MDEIAVRALKRDLRTAANCSCLQKAPAVSQQEFSRERTSREPRLHVATCEGFETPARDGRADVGISRAPGPHLAGTARASIGLDANVSCHTFRATGITPYLEAGGTLENAQVMAAHESPRTTKLYDRTGDEITLDEVERITI